MGSNDLNRAIHAVTITGGYASEAAVATSFVGFYSSVSDLDSARRVFHLAPKKDLILWSSLVAAYCKNGHFVEAIDAFRGMRRLNVSPNDVSLLSVLTACAATRDLWLGKQIHGFALRKGYVWETSLQNSLVDMYMKCGTVHVAMLIFDRIKEKDNLSWKSIILGFIANGPRRRALLLFSEMRALGMETDELILRNVIGVCLQVGELKFGVGLHCYATKIGLFAATPIGTSLLKMYADSKDVESAETLFNQLDRRDHVAWSAMVSVYSQSRHPSLALELFKEMKLAKMDVNEITLVSLLQACSSMEAHKLGRSIHARVLRLGYDSNVFVNSALIDHYCKNGRLWQGEAVFYNLQSKDLVCWSSMINGYGIHGYGKEAIKTFSRMLEDGVMPNDGVFVSVLSTCSHCCLLEEGWKWFNSMEERFSIRPKLAHYSCMVDLLGRQGEVEKALGFIEGMPFEPDASMWVALLSHCRATSDDIKIAETAVKQLMKLDMHDTSYFVTLANMYSILGLWKDAERIRGLMESKGLKKLAGSSVV